MNAYEKYKYLRKRADRYMQKCFDQMEKGMESKIKGSYLTQSFLKLYCDYHRFEKLEEFIVEEDK